jgi:hypothetical protein
MHPARTQDRLDLADLAFLTIALARAQSCIYRTGSTLSALLTVASCAAALKRYI